ncbi:hypothetical protein HYT25_04425 [Candidatus Pacearchaeota archaeon]|nr:hypothetical protein [Candidatus Pacearchaeota archaeon]
MGDLKKELTSARLKNFKRKLTVTEKSKQYIEKELPKIRNKEAELRKKMSREKKAISLINRAKKLR